MLTKPITCQRVKTICFSTCLDQTPHMLGRTQNISQRVLNKQNISQQRHKMHLNICWPNPSHASGAQNASQHKTKPITCLRRHHMLLPSIQYSYVDKTQPMPAKTKCTSTRYEQTNHMQARSQKVSQHVLSKTIPCQRGQKMLLNMCPQNSSHAS